MQMSLTNGYNQLPSSSFHSPHDPGAPGHPAFAFRYHVHYTSTSRFSYCFAFVETLAVTHQASPMPRDPSSLLLTCSVGGHARKTTAV